VDCLRISERSGRITSPLRSRCQFATTVSDVRDILASGTHFPIRRPCSLGEFNITVMRPQQEWLEAPHDLRSYAVFRTIRIDMNHDVWRGVGRERGPLDAA
jgi:hypothetical protein